MPSADPGERRRSLLFKLGLLGFEQFKLREDWMPICAAHFAELLGQIVDLLGQQS
jgi:hypothetical protein